MTSKEKAQELVDKFTHPVRWKMGQEDIKQRAKQCALIAADEIIAEYGTYYKTNVDGKYVSYWEQVKQEIEKL